MYDICGDNKYNSPMFPPSVGDYLSKEHFAHVVDEAVEEIDLRPYYNKISPVGNPSYHPRLMIKIWFYGYATKTYSSRKIEEKTHSDVAFIYLAGMQKPDFKAISEFRRKDIEELRDSFVDILQICHRLGMTKLGEISIDSKVMKANASADRTYSEKELIKEREELEKVIQEYLEKANQIDDDEDKKYGSDKRGTELPEDICSKEIRVKRIKQVVEQLKQAQEELKNTGKKKINLTDSDAQFQKDKSRKILGYRVNIAVDSNEQVIVANDVVNEQADQSQLMPMVDKVIDNVDKIKELNSEQSSEGKVKIIADSGYSSGPNLRENEDLIKNMRQKLSTEEGKKIYSVRKITAEPVLGNLSQNLGFREFLLRGRHKVRGEFSIMCSVHNLLKIARFVKGLGGTLKEALNMPKLSPALDTS